MLAVISKRIKNVLGEHGCQWGLEPDKCETERALLFFVSFLYDRLFVMCVINLMGKR